MHRILGTLLFLSLILSACSPGGLSPAPAAVPPTARSNGSTPQSPTVDILPRATEEVLPRAKLIATLATPHIDQGPDGAITDPPTYPEGCGYQWASQDLPELSNNFLKSIQQLQPEAQANAYAFGENCIGQDGTTVERFIPMETDFNVTLQVADLSNESELGEWLVKVMQVIENIPPDQISGPRPGRVSLVFQANGGETFVNFYVDQYQALPSGLSSAEIYQALQTPP